MIKSIIPEGVVSLFRRKADDNGAAGADVTAGAKASATVEEPGPDKRVVDRTTSYIDLGEAIITVNGTGEKAHTQGMQIAALFQEHLATLPDRDALKGMNVYFTAIPYSDMPEGQMDLKGFAIGKTAEAQSVVTSAINKLSQNPEHASVFSQITLLFGACELKSDVIAAARKAPSSGSAGPPPLTAEAF